MESSTKDKVQGELLRPGGAVAAPANGGEAVPVNRFAANLGMLRENRLHVFGGLPHGLDLPANIPCHSCPRHVA